jgi:hypothetical protein
MNASSSSESQRQPRRSCLARWMVLLFIVWFGVIETGFAQEPNPKELEPGQAIAQLAEQVPNVQSLLKSSWTRDWCQSIARLPTVQPRTLQLNGRDIRVNEEFFYSGRYGSPLAYARALDLACEAGLRLSPGDRVCDFGYGSIGQLRMFALNGCHATGIDVAPLLQEMYAKEDGPLDKGSVQLVHGRFPAEESVSAQVTGQFDLFLSKNTLKRGYIHPAREVTDKRMLIDLGVDDRAFLDAVVTRLKPGAFFVIYNFCPAPASANQPYIPWADGQSPFDRDELEQAGLEVVAFDMVDDEPARDLGRALGWDSLGVNLEKDLFAWYTIAKKK